MRPIEAQLVTALKAIVEQLAHLVESYDCGWWDANEEETIIQARAALRAAGEEA